MSRPGVPRPVPLTRRDAPRAAEVQYMSKMDNETLINILLDAPEFARYTIMEGIYPEGGDAPSNAVVVRGVDKETKQLVAIKLSRQVLKIERDALVTSKLKKFDSKNLLYSIKEKIRLKRHGLVALVIEPRGPGNHLLRIDLLPTIPFEKSIAFCTKACECIEFVHSHGFIHGELRFDCFRWWDDDVALLPFGSSTKSWENALSSENWRELSQQKGIEKRLSFIAPEQTGRLSSTVDHRTDIYSLGIFFYLVFTGKFAYVGTPLEIVQAALSRRLPTIEAIRPDRPPMLDVILTKMTAKQPSQRYHSVGGVRHDLQRVLEDSEAAFEPGAQDVSSVFSLPSVMFGRDKESELLLEVVKRFAKRHQTWKTHLRGTSDTDLDDDISESHSETSSRRSSMIDRRPVTRNTSTTTTTMQPLDTETASLRRCEVIGLGGTGGMGKSSLINILAHQARVHGYYASAKFDRARARPYSAILGCVRSVLQQVLAESEDAMRELSEQIQALHALQSHISPLLDLLPELKSLIITPGLKRESSTTANTRRPSTRGTDGVSHSAYANGVHNMRSGGTKLRFTTVFIDVLKVLTTFKPITFVLDDVHQADAGSLELIGNIVSSRTPMLICLSYRTDDPEARQITRLLDEPKTRATSIVLSSLDSASIVAYVAETLQRPRDFSQPLAAVVEGKSAGIPFFVREILLRLYRSKIIYFNWQAGRWDYDLSRVNKDLANDDCAQDAYILSRLRTFSEATQHFLCWAAFFGRTFNFTMVCRSMAKTAGQPQGAWDDAHVPYVTALQSCMNEGIITSADDENYTFAHDRYLSAAQALITGSQRPSIHYEVALTLSSAGEDVFFVADHLLKAQDLVRQQENVSFFRNLIWQAGQKASVSGAQAIALRYFKACYELLPDTRWSTAEYSSTLDITVRYAELCWWENDCARARELLDEIFAQAMHDPLDVAHAHILLCRVQQTLGEHEAARAQMVDYIRSLGYPLMEEPTFEKVDAIFIKVKAEIDRASTEELYEKPFITDRRLLTIAMVCTEATTAGYWSSPTWFYYLTLVMMDLQRHGNYSAAGLGFVYLGIASANRLNQLEYAVKCSQLGERLLERDADDGIKARGLMCLYAFVHHYGAPSRQTLVGQEVTLQSAISAGDRIYASFCLSHIASLSFWTAQCLDVALHTSNRSLVELTEWSSTTDAFTLITAIRQTMLALRGLTQTRDPDRILSDGKFDALAHVGFVQTNSAVPQVPMNWWQSFELVPLYHYGYYEKAVEVGAAMYETISFHPCHRHTRQALLYYGLSLVALARASPAGGQRRSEYLTMAQDFSKQIASFEGPYPYTFSCWSRLLLAEVVDASETSPTSFASATQLYTEALEIAEREEYLPEEALAKELTALSFQRRGMTSVAVMLMREAIATYSAWGATGVVNSLNERHFALLSKQRREVKTSSTQTVEEEKVFERAHGSAGEQLDRPAPSGSKSMHSHTNSLISDEVNWFSSNGSKRRNSSLMDLDDIDPKHVVTQQDQATDDESSRDLLSLDVIDLTSIIKSSRIISSEVNVETLLKRMLDIILENMTAEFGAIVVKEDGQFAIAASGTMDNYQTFKPPRPLTDDEEMLSARVVNYCIHTAETVVLPSTRDDERFSHNRWNRAGSDLSILCMPIQHKQAMVGILYIQSAPHAFQRRHVQVLGMLQQQLGISITNALLFKAAQSATRANMAMIESQKQSLAQARESEAKYVAVLEAMPTIIFTADAMGRVDYLSAYWWKTCGSDAPSWPDDAWLERFPPSDRDAFVKELASATRLGEFREFETSVRDSEGRTKAHLCRATPLRDAQGHVIKWIGALLDIHDQKIARENAIKTAAAKAAWLSSLSHEMRTPFAGVSGMLQLLAETQLDEEQHDYVQTAVQATTSLLEIIDNLLSFEKLDAGKSSLENHVFSVGDLATDCLEIIQPLATKKNLELAMYVGADVPSRMAGDSNKLRQVIVNLIGNAVKFTSVGEIVVKLSLDTDRPCESGCTYLRCEVADTGIGMRPEATTGLFQPFSQVDSSTTRIYGGTGLGLSICRQIVQLMGGKIAVESEEGRGSCFYFWVQLRLLADSVISPHADELQSNVVSVRHGLEDVRMYLCSPLKHTVGALGPFLPNDALPEKTRDASQTLEHLLAAAATASPVQLLIWDVQDDAAMPQLTAILEHKQLSRLQIIWLHVPRTAAPIATKQRTRATQSANGSATDLQLLQMYSDRISRVSKPVRRAKLAVALLKAISTIKNKVTSGMSTPVATAAAVPTGAAVPMSRAASRPLANSFGGAFTTAELNVLRTRHVLVAEDNPVQQKLLTKQLSKFGLQVDLGHNGLEAIKHFEQHPPAHYALFFCDSHMPLCSGIDTMKRIRALEAERTSRNAGAGGSDSASGGNSVGEAGKNGETGKKAAAGARLPIITLTADVVAENRENCLRAGADKYLTKPMTMASLVSALRQYALSSK